MSERIRVGFLASGSGTTVEAVMKRSIKEGLPVDHALLMTNNRNAGVIQRARDLGIPQEDTIYLNTHLFEDSDGTRNNDLMGETMLKHFRGRGIDYLFQYGWLVKTPENVIEEYAGAIFNQHPAPLPEFGGKGMYGERALAAVLYYWRMTKHKRPAWNEVVAQYAAAQYDEGAILASARVPIELDTDTPKTLQERGLPIEHNVQYSLFKKVANREELTVKERESFINILSK